MINYKISQIEINRRKKAYTTLTISLVVGLILASLIFKFPIPIYGYLLVAITMFFIRCFSFRFLNNLVRTKISLFDRYLKRELNGFSETYLLDNISHVRIKRTTNKTIREMYIWLNNGKGIFISALSHFEEFRENLLKNSNKKVVVKNVYEKIDFDHPLFYSILGLLLSFVGVSPIKYIPYLDYQYIKTGEKSFFIFLIILGIYFITTKPLTKEYGNKSVISDYVLGILMSGSGIMLWLLTH